MAEKRSERGVSLYGMFGEQNMTRQIDCWCTGNLLRFKLGDDAGGMGKRWSLGVGVTLEVKAGTQP